MFNVKSMKCELIIPIDVLRGKLRNDGFYFRKYRGQQIVQRCPNRTYHERTFAEIANQKRFAIIAAEVSKRIKARFFSFFLHIPNICSKFAAEIGE